TPGGWHANAGSSCTSASPARWRANPSPPTFDAATQPRVEEAVPDVFTEVASIDYPIIDGDAHVYEPPGVWQDRVPARPRERAPRGGWAAASAAGPAGERAGREGPRGAAPPTPPPRRPRRPPGGGGVRPAGRPPRRHGRRRHPRPGPLPERVRGGRAHVRR